MSFDGKAINDGNEIHWTSASEKESDFYTSERSVDGINFKPIANISSNTNSNTLKEYRHLDMDVNNGTYYYRLLETDLLGQTKIVSQVISLDRRNMESEELSIYPIPSSDFLNIQFQSNQNEILVFEVYNVLGQEVERVSYKATEGFNQFRIDISQYASGHYFLKIAGDQRGDFATRFVRE